MRFLRDWCTGQGLTGPWRARRARWGGIWCSLPCCTAGWPRLLLWENCTLATPAAAPGGRRALSSFSAGGCIAAAYAGIHAGILLARALKWATDRSWMLAQKLLKAARLLYSLSFLLRISELSQSTPLCFYHSLNLVLKVIFCFLCLLRMPFEEEAFDHILIVAFHLKLHWVLL